MEYIMPTLVWTAVCIPIGIFVGMIWVKWQERNVE